MIIRTCQNCSKQYETFPSIRLRFCSNACAGQHKRKGNYVECAVCKKSFWSYPSRISLYCSRSCATTARNLTDANPSYKRDISGDKNPRYGKGLTGSDNPMYGKRKELSPRWRGGRKIRKDGYVLIVAPDDHPHPADHHLASGLKYILEHRYVMEQHIGRYLEPDEVVHHIDENPSNNDISNLRLYSSQSDHVRYGHG